MVLELIIVALCVLAAVLFMARKIRRVFGGRPHCECGSCGSDSCRGCPERELRNLNDEIGKK